MLLILRWWRFQLFQYSSRVPCDHGVVWNIFGHYTACSNSNSIADGNSLEDDHVSAEPTVLPYHNRLGTLWSLGTIPDVPINWVRCCVQRAVRPDEGARANGDRTRVQERTTEVYVDILSEPATRLAPSYQVPNESLSHTSNWCHNRP